MATVTETAAAMRIWRSSARWSWKVAATRATSKVDASWDGRRIENEEGRFYGVYGPDKQSFPSLWNFTLFSFSASGKYCFSASLTGDFDEAIEWYGKALAQGDSTSPSQAPILGNRAAAYMHLKKYAKAVRVVWIVACPRDLCSVSLRVSCSSINEDLHP